jgi:signal transduction histidine kinase
MYLETERRRQPQLWLGRSQSAERKKSQVGEAFGMRRSADGEPLARGVDSGASLSELDAQGLLRKLQLLTIQNGELEAFNATVSHDLCTPLTTINGYCQVLRELCGDQLDANAKEYLQGIYEGTLRMKELISSMLEFSRSTQVAATRQSVDLSEMAALVARELKVAAPKRRTTVRIGKGITGHGDPGLWRSVLDNLIGNAWKHSAGREKTAISFGRKDLAGKPVYFVRDNGPGFDMALADRLFLPFQRVPGTGIEGHGIGLATVDRIVKRNGGRVWAESAPGAGATFYFTME